ncbi:MAG: FtsB family cell division protein [Acidobacteriota bacterium]
MSQARVSFISEYHLRDEQVLALPKPRIFTLEIPLYVLVAMVVIGLTGVWITVTLRTHSELQSAVSVHSRLQAQITLQAAENQRLQQELLQIDTDPRAIARSAREMGLVRRNEAILVVDESHLSPGNNN